MNKSILSVNNTDISSFVIISESVFGLQADRIAAEIMIEIIKTDILSLITLPPFYKAMKNLKTEN